MPDYRLAQQEKRWAKDIEDYRPRDNADMKIGILGLGVMGSATADLLASAGYCLSAWTRRKRQKDGVRYSTDLDIVHSGFTTTPEGNLQMLLRQALLRE
jgi:phosphoglycerate dehydrogenase-like enzyme